MKQRSLTPQQLKMLTMTQQGQTDKAIAQAMSISESTLSAKRAAIRRGLSKGAYIIPTELQNPNDLFAEATC